MNKSIFKLGTLAFSAAVGQTVKNCEQSSHLFLRRHPQIPLSCSKTKMCQAVLKYTRIIAKVGLTYINLSHFLTWDFFPSCLTGAVVSFHQKYIYIYSNSMSQESGHTSSGRNQDI